MGSNDELFYAESGVRHVTPRVLESLDKLVGLITPLSREEQQAFAISAVAMIFEAQSDEMIERSVGASKVLITEYRKRTIGGR